MKLSFYLGLLVAAVSLVTAVADQSLGVSDVPVRKIRVACIGDSITWGYAMTNRVEECYPARLQKILGDALELEPYDFRSFVAPSGAPTSFRKLK